MQKSSSDSKIFIYQAKAIKNTNSIQIKNIGYVLEGEKFKDERLDCGKDQTNNRDKAYKVEKDVYAIMYKSNMAGSYLFSTKKIPIMYASLMYQKSFATGYLFSINIFFEITTNTYKFKTLEDLLNATLEGKFTLEIMLDNKTEVIPLNNFAGYEETVEQFKSIISDDSTKELIKIHMEKRDKERRDRLGGTFDYSIPKNKVNFTELVNMYEKGVDMDEIIKSKNKV